MPLDEPLAPGGGGGGAPVAAGRRDVANVATLSLAFFCLFTGYNTLQGYVSTTLPGTEGFQSLAVLYASYLLFLFLAPAICARLGDKAAMLLGSACYVLFLGSLLWGHRAAVLAASAATGFGASVLWVAQGNFITSSCNEGNRGTVSGVFWSCMQASAIVGPLASYLILSFIPDSQAKVDQIMYTSFTCTAAVGAALLATLRKPALSDQNSIQGSQPPGAAPQTLAQEVCGPIRRVAQLCLKRDIALMLAACLFTGIELSFVTGEYFRLTMMLPCYYADSVDLSASGATNASLCATAERTAVCMWDLERQACTKDSSVVGLVFIAYGCGSCFAALVLGALSDGSRRGATPLRRKLVVTLGALCYGGGLALLALFKQTQHEILPRFPPRAWLPEEEKSISWLCYVIAALFGINDAAWRACPPTHPATGRQATDARGAVRAGTRRCTRPWAPPRRATSTPSSRSTSSSSSSGWSLAL